MSSRERRAQARAALSPQPTGRSESDLIDARMNRLKLEGTPRVRRQRRQASSLAPETVFSDFLVTSDGDFDFGTAAMRMLEDIRQDNSPPSPSPATLGETEMLTDT